MDSTRFNDVYRATSEIAAELFHRFRNQSPYGQLKDLTFAYVVYYYTSRALVDLISTGITGSYRRTKESLSSTLFSLFQRIPSVRDRIASELDQATLQLEEQVAIHTQVTQRELPEQGLDFPELERRLDELSGLPSTKWEEGHVSGAVYHGGKEMERIWTKAFAQFSVSNPLHADVFPGVRQMDAEIVSMTLALYHGKASGGILEDSFCGTTTSGGTESILMSCKAHRDYAREKRGITEPEMVLPVTIHAAFQKAADFFKIKVRYIPVDPDTYQVSLTQVARAINSNTILIAGSAPNFPHGIIDDIEGLSKLALRHGCGLHVDCCLGSFIVPFLAENGFEAPVFDFRLPGVTAISCDTHKYGFAPKGSSVIMYRHKSLRKHQYSVISTWPGGLYASPSIAGSRPGAVLAGTWAAMVSLGHEGYKKSCYDIVSARQQIQHAIETDFPELVVLGRPLSSVIAFTTREVSGLSIYEIGDRLGKLGWHLNALQDPPALHIACTRLTVSAVDTFTSDLRAAVDYARQLPPAEKGKGTMVTLYGLGSSSMVGPHIVKELALRYMDVMYA